MGVDGETVVTWLRTWGVESVLGLLALAGLGLGWRGDALSLLLGVALLAATADRVRLRLDNRSLAAAVEEASELRVSAARRETPGDSGGASADEPSGTESDGRATAPDADS
ncbi:MAG: hypothetical protein ABEJ43_05680 [Haloferacaceae archaeon]